MKELLNRLCGLGEGTLVLRQQGLSLAKRTPIGLCVAYGESGWNLLRDRLSGLEIDTGRARHFYLLADAGRRPLLGAGDPGQPLHWTFRLEAVAWQSPNVQNLIREFDGMPLDCLQSRQLGAGAWLDEWERPVERAGVCDRVMEMSHRLRECRRLEVEVQAGGHRALARFTPSFVDVVDEVLRIADRSLRHVVHVNAADSTLDFSRESGFQWRMCKLDKTAFQIANENGSR